MKEERKMICYHELRERKGNGLLSWIEKKGRKEDDLLFWVERRKKGRWFVILNCSEERKEDGLLFRFERKEERKMVCYYELKGRKEDGLLFRVERKEERKMVCYYELKGWLVEVVEQMGKYTDSFPSFLFFFNLLLKSSHLLSMSFLDSGSKNKQRITNIRI